jgi:ribosomal protein S27AE
VSNKRRPRDSRRERSLCGSCGRAASINSLRLRDGRLICPRCRDSGVLAQRLPCGHIGIPGTMVIADSADKRNFQCIRCSADSTLPGKDRV